MNWNEEIFEDLEPEDRLTGLDLLTQMAIDDDVEFLRELFADWDA